MVFRTSWYCAGWALIILHLAVYHQHQDYDNLRLPEMKPISLCLFPCLRFVTMIIPRLEEASLFLIDVISVWHQHIYEASIFMFMQQRQNYEVIQLDYFESIFKLYFASSSTFMFSPICSRFWYLEKNRTEKSFCKHKPPFFDLVKNPLSTSHFSSSTNQTFKSEKYWNPADLELSWRSKGLVSLKEIHMQCSLYNTFVRPTIHILYFKLSSTNMKFCDYKVGLGVELMAIDLPIRCFDHPSCELLV